MIAVFVRPATPGRAKTRLIPALGAEGAAALYRAMASDVIAQVCQAGPGRVVCWVAGSVDDPDLDFVPEGLPRFGQPEADLGTRMRVALDHAIEASGFGLLVGSDAPGLSGPLLRRTTSRLEGCDVILGPSADGGFTCIGARRTRPTMFDGVRMSTRNACSDTQLASERAGLSVALGEPWFDVDSPADLSTLHALVGRAPELAPRTARALLALTSRAL